MVIGTGLVGGSIGLALRARGWHVTGRDIDAECAKRALDLDALDSVGEDPEAEVVFVATPLGSVAAEVTSVLEARRGLLEEHPQPNETRAKDAPAAAAGGPTGLDRFVVTDVAGVKGPVVAAVDEPHFVGGHPMAGSEQVGVEGANADLFLGATWVLTPTEQTDPAAYALLRGVIAEMGAEVVALSPQQHDTLVAVVSHVPHLTAATLMNLADRRSEQHAALLRLAAGGFRDMTRVAAGQPSIWPDVCAENSRAIVETLDALLAELTEMRERVASADRDAIYRFLDQAATARRSLPAKSVPPDRLVEIRVPVPDRPGVLAQITTLAGDLAVNIADLEIAHSAEGERGVLVLVVDADTADRMHDALASRGFHSTKSRLT